MDINIILIPTPTIVAIMTIIGAAATDVLCYRCIVVIGLVLLLLLLPSIAITITVITISIMIIKQTRVQLGEHTQSTASEGSLMLSVCLYPPFSLDTTVGPQPNIAHIFG